MLADSLTRKARGIISGDNIFGSYIAGVLGYKEPFGIPLGGDLAQPREYIRAIAALLASGGMLVLKTDREWAPEGAVHAVLAECGEESPSVRMRILRPMRGADGSRGLSAAKQNGNFTCGCRRIR